MSDFYLKCVAATKRYLQRQDYEILAVDFNFTDKINIICVDPRGSLRFIRVKGYKRAPQEGDQKFSSKLRAKMESGMFTYINEHNEYIDVPAHLDLILIYAADSMDRAFLTHIKDAVNQ